MTTKEPERPQISVCKSTYTIIKARAEETKIGPGALVDNLIVSYLDQVDARKGLH